MKTINRLIPLAGILLLPVVATATSTGETPSIGGIRFEFILFGLMLIGAIISNVH